MIFVNDNHRIKVKIGIIATHSQGDNTFSLKICHSPNAKPVVDINKMIIQINSLINDALISFL
ncbi:hypothetical protein FACS189459_5750 [Bacilli bacterium]|nr:hypothetical protein FACS189459_5750 [Bacilli bacterium]